ncbi:hypothetical protein RHGRI_011801 [Rhododendron griersonianum]|uniref:non-specific serine/threonine protein kinase n=1 Tax=Rhododendron griersonianum TaxID=479676 RepID=A0AAV6KPC1_9ERIC|nr:hypothetical protein RHGRI_011801 [Rhododendron griersonianum]
MFLTPLFSLSPLLLLLALLPSTPAQDYLSFTFNNFKAASQNLTLDGIAEFTPSGLLALTNGTRQEIGHAFYTTPFPFKPSPNASVSSFSTSFIFSVIDDYPSLSGHGIVFVVAPAPGLPGALPSHWLGLFNETNNGNFTNHVVAVELDTIYSREFQDINDNHVGIDINGLKSNVSEPAGYNSNGKFQNLTLISGKAMQVWVEYDGGKKEMNVAIAPVHLPKPSTPLLTLSKDLSPILNQTMYVGFSSSTGSVPTSQYILAWSFKINGLADGFDFSQLPKLPRIGPKKVSRLLTIGLPAICLVLVFGVVSGVVYYVRTKRKFAEVLEDWELGYGPHRFKYKDLYIATKGFREKGLLGSGGFGRVYRGILPTSKIDIAVKRVSHESRQGMKEFVAEIVSIGREVLRTVDPKLGREYVVEEVELVLKLGLLCSHSEPVARPNMRQVAQYLEGDIPLPELKLMGISAAGLTFAHHEGFDDFALSYPSSMEKGFTHSSSVAESHLLEADDASIL